MGNFQQLTDLLHDTYDESDNNDMSNFVTS